MLSIVLPLIAFWGLFLVSCLRLDYRKSLWDKPRAAWAMDALGLLLQGWLIPLLQAYLLLPVYKATIPALEARIEIPFVFAFLLSFVAVDYLYYWNHRLLHSQRLWPWHRAHHSAEKMDIFVSSRNSLVTHFFICYVWVHSVAIYLLKDDGGYLLGIALSSALDLWRHSEVHLSERWRWLGRVLILPKDHAWHHATLSRGSNFGANLKIWDKLHGSYERPHEQDFAVGDTEAHPIRYRDLWQPIRS